MHLSEAPPSATPDAAHDAQHADEHYQPLKNAIPAWLGDTSATRREALKNSVPQQPAALQSRQPNSMR